MPLGQRIPKLPGFKQPRHKAYEVVNLTALNRFADGSVVDPQVLTGLGMYDARLPLKVLGAGSLRRKLTVRTHAISANARACVEAAGGAVELIEPKAWPRYLQASAAGPGPGHDEEPPDSE